MRPFSVKAATTAILSNLSAWSPPAECTGWYNNCLCGCKPCHICYFRAWGLGNVKYFQAVIRCELDWNRKSWQGAQQLSKDKGEHRWCPWKRNFISNCLSMFWLLLLPDGVKRSCLPCCLAIKDKKKFHEKDLTPTLPPHRYTRLFHATASQTSAGEDEGHCSAMTRKNPQHSQFGYFGSADLWICDLHWNFCSLSPSALTPVSIVFSCEPAQL